MKKILYFLFIPILAFPEKAPSDQTVSNNEFAVKIYKSLLTENTNLFISPFSLNIALAIANEGSESNTRREIENLLCLKSVPDHAELYNDFIRQTLDMKDSAFISCCRNESKPISGNEIYMANSIWTAPGVKLREPFQNTVLTQYHTEVLDTKKMDITEANKRLNQWVSEKTNHKITDIPGFDPDHVLSIINAIYFKGTWDYPFDRERTEEEDFHRIDGSSIKKDFMKEMTYYRYYEDDLLQAVMLPYTCYQFSMWILLPRKMDGLREVENKISTRYIDHIMTSHYFHELFFSMPKFRIESEITAKEAIEQMGYSGMFSDQADFSLMTSSNRVKIDQIIHKTFIEINEEQTEAAAVTKEAIVTIGMSQPSTFCADHPFMFFIMDNRTGAILFMGRYVGEIR